MSPQSQTEAEARIQAFAADWFHRLDNHAPPEDYAALSDGDHLEMHMPEGTFRGLSGFRQWYERVLGLFFDEVHTIKQVVVASGGAADVEVKVVVHWEASSWTPPEREESANQDGRLPDLGADSLARDRFLCDQDIYRR